MNRFGYVVGLCPGTSVLGDLPQNEDDYDNNYDKENGERNRVHGHEPSEVKKGDRLKGRQLG
jgi:hypothetical protein